MNCRAVEAGIILQRIINFTNFKIRRIADDDIEAAALDDAVELDIPVKRLVGFLPRGQFPRAVIGEQAGVQQGADLLLVLALLCQVARLRLAFAETADLFVGLLDAFQIVPANMKFCTSASVA